MSWIAVGVGVVGAVGGIVSRSNSNKKLSKLQQQAEDNKYVANPLAQKRLDLATTLLNARMPGATQAQANINQASANTLASVNRNATSGSQALALANATQAQQGKDFNNLANMETMDYQRRYGNLENAQQGVINEGDKEQNSKQQLLGQQAQIQGAQSANTANNWSSVSNLGFSAANFGINGGFNSGMGQNFWGGGSGGSNPGSNNYLMPRQQYNPQLLSYG